MEQEPKGLVKEVVDFREAVAKPIADYACVDAKTAPLQDIAKEVMNLHASHEKLRRRSEAERAEVVAKTQDLITRASETVDAARAESDALRVERDNALHMLETEKRQHADTGSNLRGALDNVTGNWNEQRDLCCSALAGILEFPDAVLEAAGPVVYQSLKAAFQRCGGDAADLPLPSPVLPVDTEEGD